MGSKSPQSINLSSNLRYRNKFVKSLLFIIIFAISFENKISGAGGKHSLIKPQLAIGSGDILSPGFYGVLNFLMGFD